MAEHHFETIFTNMQTDTAIQIENSILNFVLFKILAHYRTPFYRDILLMGYASNAQLLV